MKIHRILFYLLLVLLPTQLTKYFFPEFAFVSGIRVDYLAPVIYLTDLLIIGICLVSFRELFQKVKGFNSKGILFCFLLIAVNILFAINPLVALIKWIRILEAAFLVFYITIEKPNPKSTSLYLLIGGFYSCILSWFQFIGQSSIGGIFWWIGERAFTVTTPGIARFTFDNRLFLRPYATFPHPNVLAGFLTCLLPFIFFAKNTNHHTKLLFFPILILFLSTILITFSQSAWILAIITTIVFILKEKRIKLTKQKITIGIVTVIVLFVISYPFIETESIDRRISLMKNASTIIQENLISGVGLNNFILANQAQIPINSYQDLQPVHNIHLLFLSETGILGILLIMLIFQIFKSKIRVNNLHFYFIWSFGSFLIFGLFDHYPISIHQTLLLGSILLGFIISSQRMVKS